MVITGSYSMVAAPHGLRQAIHWAQFPNDVWGRGANSSFGRKSFPVHNVTLLLIF
jgi:hypothetical protein